MNILTNNLFLIGVGAGGFIAVMLFLALCFRVVVSTNAVHIVQTANKTTSYGRGQPAGNTYYSWPSWVPLIGVRVTILPVSVFDQALANYAAYDIDRVPIVIDIVGFFRIANPDVAAERVKDFPELLSQLNPILQGAARSILASSPIDEILGSRAVFGEKFTAEVTKDLLSWGVEPVKSIELMDIRDAEGSKAISNIMAKKKSFIEMESRVAVAENTRKAETAEIEATRQVALSQQEAQEQVGVRTAQKEQTIGITTERAKQAVREEAKTTATKDMAVQEVQQVRTAEIQRGVQLVQADQEKQTSIIKADGEKQRTVIAAEGVRQQTVIQAEGEKSRAVTLAEGNLATAKLGAEGITAQGEAKATAEKLMLLAPVDAQITLAKEIGANPGYQTYLVSVKSVEANRDVGMAQAGALEKADIKIIANTGTPTDGISSVRELLSSRGGMAVGAMMEGLKTTETGAAMLRVVTGDDDKKGK